MIRGSVFFENCVSYAIPLMEEIMQSKVYLWNNHGGELEFASVEIARMRCLFRGESATPGVNMYDVDGIRYFTKDM